MYIISQVSVKLQLFNNNKILTHANTHFGQFLGKTSKKFPIQVFFLEKIGQRPIEF